MLGVQINHYRNPHDDELTQVQNLNHDQDLQVQPLLSLVFVTVLQQHHDGIDEFHLPLVIFVHDDVLNQEDVATTH